jgi:hypothetical protein
LHRCVGQCRRDRTAKGTQVVVDIADAANSVHKPAEKHDGAKAEHGEGDGNTSTGAASPADVDMDLVDEHHNQDAWSEPTSISHAKVASRGSSPSRSPRHGSQRPTPSQHGQNHSPPNANFSLDDAVLGVDPNVGSFELPSFEDAERLFKCYMENCHNSFPFLAKMDFTRLFYDCTYIRQIRSRPQLQTVRGAAETSVTLHTC